MIKRLLAIAAAAMAVTCAPAFAAPVGVQLRVEGTTSTIFEGPVTTDGKLIDKGDGPHPCDGTTNSANAGPGPTVTSALDDASLAAGFAWQGTWFSFGDFLLNSVAGESGASSATYWGTVLNYQPTPVGGCQQRVAAGDDVLIALGDIFGQPLLKLSGPVVAALGAAASVTVVDGKTGSAVAGATIGGAPGSPTTGGDGRASVVFDSPGVKRLKADAPGAIRSNALLVCVPAQGAADCGADTPRPTAGSGAAARDARAPTARISSPRDSVRYRRGARVLRGRATDEASGIASVELAFRHYLPGKKCRWWNARSERFVRSGCRTPRYFSVGSGERWSYLLPKALPRGRYLVEVRARDRAGNREQRFERGRNRIGFTVTSARLRKAAMSSRRRSRAPAVQVLVVGKDGVLASARSVRAARRAVEASGSRCLVPASTPLAALDARLATARVGYHARDFGRCSARSAGASRQLFVDRIGPDRNRGRDGWFYKLNDLAGTAGGADPSGIPGGRLRRGDRVLWFYCRFDVAAGSCQRSLRIILAGRVVRPGAPVAVRVRGYDNEARGRPAGGASVGLGALSAVVDSGGKATISAPGTEGNYVVTATVAGAVPAFPVALAVRSGAAEN